MSIDAARLRWRCRRGMLELDLLLEGFLDRGYAALADADRERFVELLALPDQTLLDQLLGLADPPESLIHVVAAVRASAHP